MHVLLYPELEVGPPKLLLLLGGCKFSLSVTEEHKDNGGTAEEGLQNDPPTQVPAFVNDWGQESGHFVLEDSSHCLN